MGLYSFKNHAEKVNNPNITKKMISNLDFSENINFFQKVKNLILKQHTQWLSCKVALSLISIKSEQVSKICFMVKCWSHPMHAGKKKKKRKKEGKLKKRKKKSK